MKEVLKLFCLFLLINIITSEVNDRYYPRYHLAPPHGWMNDPNGFSFYKNEFHLFYQFNPYSSLEPGIANWGHAKSKDLFHWEHLPIALRPDKDYDKSGVFSGSALIVGDRMYLFYTGNANMPGNDPDNKQVQALALSDNGARFFKLVENPIINGKNHQPNFRDPKVWAHGGKYYMVLGNSFNNNTLGRALLYSSKNLFDWNEVAILDESDGSLGYMWECPDFFEIGGKFVLLFSPQGIEPDGDNYRNLYQTGYIVGDFDYESNVFSPLTSFVELDHGHDFYATQTIEDNFGRRILVAWLDMWKQDYPERQDGWTGQMSIPRELSLTKDNVLIQKPVNQVAHIRRKTLYSGNMDGNHDKILLSDKAGEISIRANNSESFDLIIESSDDSANVTLRYDHSLGTVSLDRGGEDGVRTAKWKPNGVLKWQVFIDASSIELFCGNGELTFSSRFFPKEDVSVRLANKSRALSFILRSLDRSVAKP